MRLTFCLIMLLMPLAAAGAGDLTIAVTNVASSDGQVRVAVCTVETFLERHCPYNGSAPAVAGETEVRVEGVAPGGYAVQAFHDANGNADLDRSFLGLPEEGVGFSRDAPMRFGPPDFEDAQISIGQEDAKASLRLRYF